MGQDYYSLHTISNESYSFKQPQEITTFSRDIDGKYHFGERAFSYYYFPDSYINRNFDMKEGFSSFKQIPEANNIGDIKVLLESVMRYEKSIGAKVLADVVTFRGIITKLTTAQQLKEPFKLKVLVYDGTIFIQLDHEYELRKRTSLSKGLYQSQCEYSGYKFEKLVMLPKPWNLCSRDEIESRHEAVVNNYEQAFSVIKTSIGKVKMILAGEIDGVFDYLDDKGNNLSHYIELKTHKVLDNYQREYFETKLFKAWVQSFLVGVKKVAFGFRSEGLILKNIELYETEEIPVMLKNKINCMKALKFLGGLMQWLNSIDKSINQSFILQTELGSVRLIPSEVSWENEFLTEEFIQWRQSLQK